jgi:AcrR family transcriptional regulator
MTGTGDERPTREDASRLARAAFLDGRRLDMNALSRDLGVNRVTLYRWVGSRNALLVEVLWSIAAYLLEQEGLLASKAGAVGGERVVRVIVGFLDRVITGQPMQRLLAEEGELAMRLLTRHDAGFQPRLVAAVQELLEQEIGGGTLTLDAETREVAYVIVRLIESYTYLDLITGEQPEAARAEPILRMLLR